MQIPNKSQFKIDEVSSITGVKSYVLRFWESEFEQINPTLSSTGHKLYDHNDVEVVALLKKLLFEDKMTIEEAKKELDNLQRVVNSVPATEPAPVENEVMSETSTDTKVTKGDKSESRHKRKLTDSEIQKIVLAKAKINSILSLISDFKQFHH